MDFSHGLLLFYTILICYNLGTIWFVQIVVYPLFAKVGPAEYVTYHRFYTSQIPLPVIIPGFSCFLVPIAIVFLRPESVPLGLALANAACGLLGLWVTVALEIPRHSRLEQGGKQPEVIQELIRYNWPRTLSISGSAIFTVAMLIMAFLPA